ncbi:MAG: hypothetical protein AB7I27_19120 [Bacteriovoracaceae bacterium]
MKFLFLVQGSSSDPYEVEVNVEDRNLSVSCDCAASINGQICKHRLRIISGSTEGIVSDNKADVRAVRDAFEKSEVMSLIVLRDKKEQEIESLKKEVKELSKKISSSLRSAS